jgi:hypothetical protein
MGVGDLPKTSDTALNLGTMADILVNGYVIRATFGLGGSQPWWPGRCIAWWPEPGQRRKYPVGTYDAEVLKILVVGRGERI